MQSNPGLHCLIRPICPSTYGSTLCFAVHGTDHSRLDLIVPGEQHFYIKASNPQERQEWLVALGSTKASMGKTIEEPGIS